MSDFSSSTCLYVSYSHFTQDEEEEVFNEMIIINIEQKHVLIRCLGYNVIVEIIIHDITCYSHTTVILITQLF
jgi:hypothetical protein